MTLAVYTHADCLRHDTGPSHPENAGRLSAILDALKSCGYADRLAFIDAPMGAEENILLAHTPEHLNTVKDSIPKSGYDFLDGGDAVVSPGSLDAAYRAVGAACASVDDVLSGKYSGAFCAVRPPGHHAERNQPMGFCLFNNIAIAALYALEHHKLARVAIVDFDVHHGNGTQDIVQADKRILYISTHQSPFYPGTGRESEKGMGNILNIELPASTDGEAYRDIFSRKVIPALENFKPEFLLISAGFDAHKHDPLAGLNLSEEDFAWIGEQLSTFARNFCHGHAVSMLEGGYNHKALAASAVAYLRAFI